MSSHNLQNLDLRVERLDVLVPCVQGFLAVTFFRRLSHLNFQQEAVVFRPSCSGSASQTQLVVTLQRVRRR